MRATIEERVTRLEADTDELRTLAEQVSERADTTDSRNRRALALLSDLMFLPDQRPDAWEAVHVEALKDRLAPVFDVLSGADA